MFGAGLPRDSALCTAARGKRLFMGTSLILIFAFMFCALCIPDGIMHVVYGMNYEVFRRDLPPSLFPLSACLLRLFWYVGATLIGGGLCVLVNELVCCFPNVHQSRLQKLFTYCGRHSLAIYILHRPIRDLWIKFFL